MTEAFDWTSAKARLETLAGAGPSPDRARAVLEDRARRWAEVRSTPPRDPTEVDAVVFRSGGRPYGVEPAWIQGVLSPRLPTPVPGAPPHLAGVLHHRGEILAVFDLSPLSGAAAAGEASPRRLVVVVGTPVAAFGIQAETVEGLVRLPGPAGPPSASERLPGLIRHRSGESVFMIDVGTLAVDPRVAVNHER